MFSLQSLFNNLDTNWKDNAYIKNIINRHAQDIDCKLENQFTQCDSKLEIFPPRAQILQSFNLFDMEQLSVVIIGLDPYINKGEAMGLSFSVPNNIKCPPSLRNIFKELKHEYGRERIDTNLTDWGMQGVLLLNSSLTVLEKKTGSHVHIWKPFIEDIIKYLGQYQDNIVFMLWGKNAKQFQHLIDNKKNYVLTSIHPSPLAQTRGKLFVGNNHFTLCNKYLRKYQKPEIQWI